MLKFSETVMLKLFSNPLLIELIERHAIIRSFEKDGNLIVPGETINSIPIVIEGCIRILRCDNDGKEVFLYHLYPGQTCTLSLSSCQTGSPSMIRAVAEDHTIIALIPAEFASEWYRFPEWKNYINNSSHKRFGELMQVIDLIAFSHMDKQLLHYLEERAKAGQSKMLHITHEEIAEELHTHREAVSRLLRTMEEKGLVTLGRNIVELN